MTSSATDKKLEIDKKLENKLEIYKNLEIKLEIYKNLEIKLEIYSYLKLENKLEIFVFLLMVDELNITPTNGVSLRYKGYSKNATRYPTANKFILHSHSWEPGIFFFIRKQFSGKTFPYFAQEQKMFYMPFVLGRVAHKWYLCTTDISMAPTTSQIYDECQSQPAKVWAMMPGNIICQTIPTTPLIFDVSFKLATLCWV